MKKPIDPTKQFNAWMRNILRKTFFRWHQRTVALHSAKIDRGQYQCANCKKIFKPKEIRIDHIDPVVDPKIGFVSWDIYISRLFCDATNLQILCVLCHSEKTAQERHERKAAKTGIYSPDRSEKISKGRTGIQAYTRPVVATNLLTQSSRFFISVSQAAKILCLSAGHIHEACNAKRKQVKGWAFKYA